MDAPIFSSQDTLGWPRPGSLDAARADLMTGVAILALVEDVAVFLLTDVAFDGLEVGDLKFLEAGVD